MQEPLGANCYCEYLCINALMYPQINFDTHILHCTHTHTRTHTHAHTHMHTHAHAHAHTHTHTCTHTLTCTHTHTHTNTPTPTHPHTHTQLCCEKVQKMSCLLDRMRSSYYPAYCTMYDSMVAALHEARDIR